MSSTGKRGDNYKGYVSRFEYSTCRMSHVSKNKGSESSPDAGDYFSGAAMRQC